MAPVIPSVPGLNTALVTAIEASADGVFICDADVEIVYASSAVEELATGNEDSTPEDLFEVLGAAVDGRRTERLLERTEGLRRSIRIVGIPVLDEKGESGGAIGVILDTTKSGVSDKVLSDFVANVSHELKTPIGALGLLAETLLTENDPEVAQRLVQRLQLESIRVSQTVDDLMKLSRIEGAPKDAPGLVPVRAVLEAAMGRVNYSAEHRKVRITVSGAEDATFYGHHTELVSALQHLLENAIKYSNPNTTIEVSVKTVEGWTEIGVTDHGDGIAPQYLDRIFERFYRVDDARTRSTGGTGLGLSLVKHVAQNHGGDITVTSQEGVGSTFKLRLAADSSTATPIASERNDDGDD